MKVLVTGGAGFLGSAIVRRLVERGFEVRTLSRGSYDWLERLGVRHFRGSLADYETVSEACRGVEALFHVAAKAGIWGPPKEFFESNVIGTRQVLKACREHSIGRLVFTSSPSVIFDGTDMEGADESVPYPDKYKADYPRTKAESEKMVLAANDSNLATVALRPHLIWGPGDTHLVPGIVARGCSGSLRKIGEGKHLVDFTFIDNAAEAHLSALESLGSEAVCSGRAYFITNGEPTPLWEFINRILDCAGCPPVKGSVPKGLAYTLAALLEGGYRLLGLSGEPRLTRFLVEELSTAHWFDISAAQRDLGYVPRVAQEEGFEQLAKWFRQRSKS